MQESFHYIAEPRRLVHAKVQARVGIKSAFTGEWREREANNSDSSPAERSARTATRWSHGRGNQSSAQSGGEVSDQRGLTSEVGQFRGCSLRSKRKLAVLTFIAVVLAGRSLAGYCFVLGDRRIETFCREGACESNQ